MAKIVKSTREVLDIDEELKKVKKIKQNGDSKKDNVKRNSKKSLKEKKGLFRFFHNVSVEMSKVKWPNKKDMIKYSAATISFVLFFGIYFSIINLIVAAVKMWV